MRTSNPNLAGGRGPSRPPGLASQPPTHMTQPPASSRTGLFIGLGVGALLLVGGGIVVVRMAGKSAEVAMEQQAQKDAARARAAAAKKREDVPPVFLSIVTEPGEADVVATWSGGEEKGQAPFSFEVPKNTKVHFEFSKTGYASYSMDVIADQAQQVRAILHAAAVAEKKDARKKKPEGEKKAEQLPGEGVIDLDDALK